MAEEDDIKGLKKLFPEERIRKLKEIQEKNKKEIDEAQELIRESEQEAARDEEVRRIPIPQLKSVDIDALFSNEEKEMFKAKRFVENKEKPVEEKSPKKEKKTLEEVAEEAPRLTQEEQRANIEYAAQMSRKPLDELKQRFDYIQQKIDPENGPDEYQRQELYNLGKSFEMKEKDIETGRYTPSEKSKVVGTLDELREKQKNMYKGI